ncbi:MAG: hypothetical protein LBP89_00095 [Helicobacteraceae bacterium]|jgi:predicted DNA-binding protein|nr:hypothetical protein [Helicobacteraceae bacterium]
MNVTRSFSLDISLFEGIRDLAQKLGKKQNQIIKESFALYLKSLESNDENETDVSDRDLAIQSKEIGDAFRRGEFKAISFNEIKAAHDAKLAKAAAV